MQAGLLDTAACDGPVQFHRVVNKYFTVDNSENKTGGLEATGQKDTDTGDTADTGGDTGDTYCCVYCNLIFKSHYCYQKHKRYIRGFLLQSCAVLIKLAATFSVPDDTSTQ